MRTTYDVAVIGLGVTGAAATAELAARGLRVAGFDRHDPPHGRGSSHGRTRIIREAYFEDPLYVPWVRWAHDGWAALEARTRETLFIRTGVLTLAPADQAGAAGSVAAGALGSARVHGVDAEPIDPAEIARRFPALAPPADYTGILEPGAGVLLVERCVRALHERAAAHGAELRTGTRVIAIEAAPGGMVVVTQAGRVRADRVVVAAGAWTSRLLGQPPPLLIERQTTHWYAPAAGHESAVRAGAMPVTLWQDRDGTVMYTIPDVGEGVKAALHHGGPAVDADAASPDVSESEWRAIEAPLRRYVPGVGERLRAAPCLYTNTPDRHFLVDAYPPEPRILVASACSGHGFKFAPAIAAAIAARVLDEPFPLDASPFRWSRPAMTAGPAAAGTHPEPTTAEAGAEAGREPDRGAARPEAGP